MSTWVPTEGTSEALLSVRNLKVTFPEDVALAEELSPTGS